MCHCHEGTREKYDDKVYFPKLPNLAIKDAKKKKDSKSFYQVYRFFSLTDIFVMSIVKTNILSYKGEIWKESNKVN